MATNSEISCSEHKSIKILFLGEVGVGKTTLLKKYLGSVGRRVEESDNEDLYIFATYSLKMKYKGRVVDVGLIDLYPGSNSPERRDNYPIGVNAIVLCFCVGFPHTLSSLSNLWIHEVRAHYGKSVPVFLVGLRSDIRIFRPLGVDSTDPQRQQTPMVEKEEAATIHKNYEFHGAYLECNMYDEDSVKRVIKKALIAAISSQN